MKTDVDWLWHFFADAASGGEVDCHHSEFPGGDISGAQDYCWCESPASLPGLA